MKIPTYLKKIESQLNAFAITENVENLQKARELISSLERKIQRRESKEYAKRFADKVQKVFKSYINY